MNWRRFWLRLTTVVSIIAYIITWIVTWNIYDTRFNRVDFEEAIPFLIPSLLTPIAVWVLYFAIRWIYKGLK